MWICLTDAFFSIVEHYDNDEHLVVRSRFKGDIEKVFGLDKAEVRYTPENDYCYRAVLTKDAVAEVMAIEVKGIDYPNFKNQAHKLSETEGDARRVTAYHKVWQAMNDAGDAGCYKFPNAWPSTQAEWTDTFLKDT
mgnify:CR=1 FL=1|jgi:hypothetical protein|tara:strand:- start:1349 stop:1756 length:408 start_codon:yes stop_codon:yes gene_type:complete